MLWLEDGSLRRLDALVRDPVCGMLLDPAQAPASVEQEGATLFFCSPGCAEEYARHERTRAHLEPVP